MVASLCEMRHLADTYHLSKEAYLRKTPKNGKSRAKVGNLAGDLPMEFGRFFSLRENSPIPQENDNHQQEWDDNEQHTLIHRVTAFLRTVLGTIGVSRHAAYPAAPEPMKTSVLPSHRLRQSYFQSSSSFLGNDEPTPIAFPFFILPLCPTPGSEAVAVQSLMYINMYYHID